MFLQWGPLTNRKNLKVLKALTNTTEEILQRVFFPFGRFFRSGVFAARTLLPFGINCRVNFDTLGMVPGEYTVAFSRVPARQNRDSTFPFFHTTHQLFTFFLPFARHSCRSVRHGSKDGKKSGSGGAGQAGRNGLGEERDPCAAKRTGSACSQGALGETSNLGASSSAQAGNRMILINVLHGIGLKPASVADNALREQVLCKPFARPARILKHLRSASVTPEESSLPIESSPIGSRPLSPELLGRLLGKSPLRLVTARTPLADHVWLEKLECGHEVQTFQQFVWDGGLVWLPITAKRRRCRPCKAAEDLAAPPVFERDALEAKAAKIWALTIEQRKIQYGSLYDDFFDERGCRRTDEPLGRIGAVAKNAPVAPVSPKKPVQSVPLDGEEQEEKA
jgi:hypothetical protein